MKIDESLYRIFLEEVNALETFRMAYAASHPGVPLDREDPDVKRLIEAMAFFSSRTRLAGSRNIIDTRRRIFQQFFPYLLTPMPSMSILQALPTRRIAETLFFPKGSEITVSPESGGAAIFRTLHDLRILPVSLVDFRMLLLPDKGFRLALRLRASFACNEEIGRFTFFINHLNDHETSQRVIHYLKCHLIRASVIFNEKATETTLGTPCNASFGPVTEDDDFSHPLQKERLFFHFPWQELFLHVQVSDQPHTWKDFTVCLDLDSGWPRNLVLTKDVFHIFAVPIINLRQAMGQPITCTGMRESHAVRDADLEYGFKLHSVLGVYEIAKGGMVPIKPGILSGAAPSYEINEVKDGGNRKNYYLNTHFPQAFQDPKTIATDALWMQPWFSETISQRLKVTPFSRSTVGLKWELPINPVPHSENLLQDNMDGFLHFLALSNKATLSRDDLMDILQTMGVMQQAQFKKICELLEDVRIERTLHQSSDLSGFMKHRYILCFQEYDPGLEPLIEVFQRHIENILDAWISSAKIEVRAEIAGR